jgi:solute carrier family 35 (UDP-sugar transporter), member A1/2/3
MVSLKWISLGIMAFQNGLTPLIFRHVMTSAKAEDRFQTVDAVFMQETLKLLLSILLLFWEEGQSFNMTMKTLSREIWDKPRDTLKLGIPAVLYFIQNVCLQLASANLPAAVFQVTYQGKSLIVAMCSVLLLSKKLKRIQWMAIGLMGSGLAIVQLARSKESKQSTMANKDEQLIAWGILYTVIAALCSGFAGVYFEKMMKQPTTNQQPTTTASGPIVTVKKPSMWVRNIQLAGFSMLIGLSNILMKMAVTSSSSSPTSAGLAQVHDGVTHSVPTAHYFLKGFTWSVWGMVLNNAVGGLCVAMVIKYADNILKGFACAIATIWAAIAAVPLFGFTLKPVFLVGMLVVLVSVLLYGGNIKVQHAYWNEEPPFCTKCRKEGGRLEINRAEAQELKKMSI